MNRRPKYVNISPDVIENTVSINSIAMTVRENEEESNENVDKSPSVNIEDQFPRHKWKRDKEYTVDRTVDYAKTKSRISYHMQWYKYKPVDDMYEPESNISTHFIDLYWNRIITDMKSFT